MNMQKRVKRKFNAEQMIVYVLDFTLRMKHVFQRDKELIWKK